ncbi:autotransporter outer membrane beta-barrel domain-containing protein [Pseudomonas graminis]
MPFTPHQLVLAFALGVASIQYAQAVEDWEPDNEWTLPPPVIVQTEHQPHEPDDNADFFFVDHATTRNGRQVARVLDAAVETLLESGELTEREEDRLEELAGELGNLAPGRLGNALEQLAGSQNANLGTATQNSMKQINSNLLATLRELSDNRDDSRNGRFWLQVLDNTGSLDKNNGSAGLQQRTQGLMLGSDWAVDDAWRIGVVGGKSTSDLSAKRFKGELDSWHLGAYAVRQDGPLALRLGAIYSSHAGQNKRTVDFNFRHYSEQAKSKYDAQSQNAFAELGYQLDLGNLHVEPFAGVGYQRYQRDRYKEKGGFSALSVSAQTQENLSSTLGLRVAGAFELGNRMVLKPHLSTGWKHLYGDVGSSVRQSSAWVKRPGFNSEFTVQGTSLDRDSLALRTGVDLALSPQHSVGLAYTAEVGSNSRNQGLMGQWTLAF